MNKAASLADIKQRLQKALPRTVITSHKEPVPEMSFMTSQTMNRPVRLSSRSLRRKTRFQINWYFIVPSSSYTG
jgi:hypothetical protein